MTTVLWDVDTQNDYADPRGIAFVPDALYKRRIWSALYRAARQGGWNIISSIDWHPSYSRSPAIENTWGAQKIPETALYRAQFVQGLSVEIAALESIIPKIQDNVFSNPLTLPLLEKINPRQIYVMG